MQLLKYVIRNTFRHKLRTLLTFLGIAIAVMAFVLMRTVIDAWYYGVNASSANRLITRHAVSFVFSLPLAYGEKIKNIPGVKNAAYAVWFQGIYKDRSFKNFFPRMAVDAENYFKVYPEFVVPPDQMTAFLQERKAAIIGAKTAREHGMKIGDVLTVDGDIYPGTWEFVIRGIYTGRQKTTDETQMLFDWRYLDENVRKTMPGREGQVGWYVLQVQNPNESARISETVDALFKNSTAETKTETEQAFNQSFVSMSGAILSAMDFISFVIIGIILLVLANTMTMTARERITEYSVLKTLGFTGKHLLLFIGGEAMFIAVLGGLLGLAFAYPVCKMFAKAFPTIFPVFEISTKTVLTAFSAALLVGISSSLFPILKATRTRIVDGLRQIG